MSTQQCQFSFQYLFITEMQKKKTDDVLGDFFLLFGRVRALINSVLAKMEY